MSFNCKFCNRTFSTRSALTQHVNYCILNQYDSEDSGLISNINDMSLGSEGFFSNIEEVKN
jgi:hypothetical protein